MKAAAVTLVQCLRVQALRSGPVRMWHVCPGSVERASCSQAMQIMARLKLQKVGMVNSQASKSKGCTTYKSLLDLVCAAAPHDKS